MLSAHSYTIYEGHGRSLCSGISGKSNVQFRPRAGEESCTSSNMPAPEQMYLAGDGTTLQQSTTIDQLGQATECQQLCSSSYVCIIIVQRKCPYRCFPRRGWQLHSGYSSPVLISPCGHWTVHKENTVPQTQK